MYIRRTTIQSRRTGEPYSSHRLVESVRTAQGVKQRKGERVFVTTEGVSV